MKILWYNWRDIKNPEAGGAEVYTHEIARRLVERGYSVTLFTAEFNRCRREEIVDGIRIIRRGGKYSVYRKAREYWKKNKNFDVVIDEINTRPFLTPKYADREKIIALIHQLAREFWFYETPFPVSMIGYYFLENYWLRHYRSVPTITVSESTKSDLEQLGFKKVFIVPNGLDVKPLDAIPKKSERPTVIFLGRMKRAKKPQDVVEAFKLVKKEVKDAQLWMVGDGYLRRKLEQRAKGVKFFGFVNGKTRVELLKKAWVIAVPGVREGWGQVVTQANACATPAVGYDIPGLRDSIKHRYNGLLVESGDIHAFAEAMIKVLIDDELRKKLSNNALEWAKQFSWDKSAEEFERVIDHVIE
jgi:glycosyltransferase involved in cell wall biosynthesis